MVPPKLVIVTHEFAPFRGGVATYVEEVGRAIHRAGTAVEIWSPDYGRAQRDDSGCPVARLPAGGSLKWRHVVQFAQALAARRTEWENATVIPASVGAHMAFMLLAAKRVARAKRMVSLLHGSEVLRFAGNPLWRWLARRLYREIQHIVTVSQFSKSLIEQSFLASFAGKIAIAPCACSSAAMREVTAKRMDDGRLRVLTLARVHPRKGQLDTARALGRLPAEMRSRLIYQIGGTGDADYLKQIERACAATGLAFEYLGEIPPESLAETYAQCDLYAMTSRRLAQSVEGFGITYLEAGFHGKPVVGYRSGGAEEAVLDGKTGLLVDEGNLTALTNAFAELIADASLRERLGAAGREQARSRT